MSSHNGHCAPAARVRQGRFFRANLAYGKFLLNLAASICALCILKLDLISYMLPYMIPKANKNMSSKTLSS
jgi:hypothetical protein